MDFYNCRITPTNCNTYFGPTPLPGESGSSGSGGTGADLSYYTTPQTEARYAKVVAVQPGTELVFMQDAKYALVPSGTFTVTKAGAKVGVVVRVRLDATAPTLPSGFTKLTSAAHTAGKVNLYSFCMAADGMIDYFITVLP